MKNTLITIGAVVTIISCKPEIHREYMMEPCPENIKISAANQIANLKERGYQIFDMVDEETGDTLIMQQYFMAFLKSGENRNQSQEEAERLQAAHMNHLSRMYQEAYADISGPFGDEGTLRGITIYNVPTLRMADSLANLDPMVQSGRLTVEIKPWWAGKGYGMR